MTINWIQILVDILMVVFGFIAWYFRTKTNLVQKAKEAINGAEKAYEDVAKAGGKKFEFAVDLVFAYVPTALKPFITREVVGNIVQTAFDGMARFAQQQLDKVFNKPHEIEG